MGLLEASPPSVPASKEVPITKDQEEKLSEWYASWYRSLVARANYLAHDRADIQYACKELSSAMATPSKSDLESLKRVERYFKGTPRVVQQFPWHGRADTLTVFSDANWAGDKETRKSTLGGAFRLSGHTLKTWSKTQTVVALS